jgi:ubiquinone/menaquinone biosynthesis C-methylase UbiE
MAEIDLDDLADAYRLRPMSNAARERAAVSARGCIGVLLDVGGGNGGHAAAWQGSDRYPIVIDPSSAMLERARGDHGVAVVRARSQDVPLHDDVASLAYFHLSIHYGDWVTALDEAFRVVAPGGRIEIWTMSHESIQRSSLGRWFPRVVELDSARFPDPELLAAQCSLLGATVTVTTGSEFIVRRAEDWIDAVRGRFVSTLQLLTDSEIDDGLKRFLAEYSNADEPYRYELCLTRISTIVRPLR